MLTAAPLATAGTCTGRPTGPVYRRHGSPPGTRTHTTAQGTGKTRKGQTRRQEARAVGSSHGQRQDRQTRRDRARRRLGEGSLMGSSGGGRCSDWGAAGAQRRERVPPAWMRRSRANALWSASPTSPATRQRLLLRESPWGSRDISSLQRRGEVTQPPAPSAPAIRPGLQLALLRFLGGRGHSWV